MQIAASLLTTAYTTHPARTGIESGWTGILYATRLYYLFGSHFLVLIDIYLASLYRETAMSALAHLRGHSKAALFNFDTLIGEIDHRASRGSLSCLRVRDCLCHRLLARAQNAGLVCVPLPLPLPTHDQVQPNARQRQQEAPNRAADRNARDRAR